MTKNAHKFGVRSEMDITKKMRVWMIFREDGIARITQQQRHNHVPGSFCVYFLKRSPKVSSEEIATR